MSGRRNQETPRPAAGRPRATPPGIGEGAARARDVAARRRLLLDYVAQAGAAQVDELAAHFGVSRMTVHRDLDALAAQGMLRKQHGGATIRPSSVEESNFVHRSRMAERAKDALARAAAGLVEPGQAVMMDDSTTVCALAAYLPALKPLTVISNGLGVAERLKGAHGIKLIGLGGDYLPRFNAFFGLLCEQAIASLRANTLFMSASAVLGTAVYVQDQEVTKAKRAMMGAADLRVLLVDSGKFGSTALHRLADLAEFDVVLADGGLAPETVARLREEKIDLRIVEL
jgi:DeoR/GlpR family transcriptional regulator of sugar metabolism